MESYVELKVEIHKKALGGPNVHSLHGRRVLRTIFKKIVCENVFPEVINAFLLEICKSGGISDGIEIFDFCDFCMVGRWLTLATWSQEVCRRMENLRLRLQSLYIEVH